MKRSIAFLFIVFLASSVLSHAEYAPDYFPLSPGNSWTYGVTNNLGASATTWTILPGFANINGVDTRMLFDSKDGEYMYLTNDLNGVRQHRTYSQATSTLPAMYQTFVPPFKYADALTSVGSQVLSSGIINLDVAGYGSFPFNYQGSSNIMVSETISVPAGTFTAIKFVSSLYAYGTILGQPLSESITQTFWLAKGVGIIKQITTDALSTDTFELTGTTVGYAIPDPLDFTAQIDVPLSTVVSSDPITVTGITVAANISITGGEYRIGNGAWTSAPGTVTNGQQVTVRQTSASTLNTQTTATLTIQGMSAGFKVTTIGPQVALSPSFLRFIEPTLSVTTAPQTVTVSNNGSAPLTISAISLPANFAQTNNCTGPIAVGGTCTIDVTFTPSADGIRKGILTVISDAASSPNTERVLGVGGLVPPQAVGIFREGAWYFDSDHSGGWSGCGPDTCINSFGGLAVDFPVRMSVSDAEGTGSWTPMSSGGPNHLTGVWGSSGTDVFAVGGGGTILHYDGSGWTAMNPGTTTYLYGVWGNSPSDVFVLEGAGIIRHYNGSGWAPMNSGTTLTLFRIWGGSGTDVFAVGDGGTIVHYNGSGWTLMNSGTGAMLTGVWGSSGTDVFAVGEFGTILHYNGSVWTTMTSGTASTQTFTNVWGSSGSGVFAVGSNSIIVHYKKYSAGTKIAIYRQGMWYLDLDNSGTWSGCERDGCWGVFGGLDIDIPVIGDWTGDGVGKLGVYRQGMWYLDLNGNGRWDGCGTDGCLGPFGGLGIDVPIVGDWNGNGLDKIGIYRQGMWYLDINGNGGWDGCGAGGIDGCKGPFGGLSIDVPVAGDWSGDAISRIGIYRQGMWYLDINGNGGWDGCGAGGIDGCKGPFGGLSIDKPVIK